MGIDVKESGAILWKVLGFSMNTSIKFMRNHPVFSGVSMSLLALYVILPSLFYFLLYSSPILACVVVYAREKMGLSFSSSAPKICEIEKDVAKCHLRQQRSVRRNARMQVEEWDSQTSEEEKDKVILTSLYNDLLGRTPHFEESPKAIETDVVEDNEKSVGEQESQMSYLNVEEPMVCNEIKEEKEEMGEEKSNANEHGVLDIDRDKRLESLIARRRTKRLFKLALHQHNKLQAEETASSKHNHNNLHINVPRKNNNYSFERRGNYYPSDDSTVMGLQVPSSAPSVMLQARNPFDIPYDPQEERPILSGDSFDQEFSFLDHKDMFFSRHESFSRFDLLSTEHDQCMDSAPSTSDITTTRKCLDLDNEHEQTTIEDDNKCVESGELVVNNETDSDNEDDDDSSCSEESESEHNRFNKAELKEAISHTMDNHPGFLVNQARNGIPSPLPRGLAPPKLDDNNMLYARRRENSHSRTFSMASDMQVEVSENGSPPTTVDWLDEWSNDGESYMYDNDIDREVIRGEESRKRVSSQCESKEENSWLETKPVVEQSKNWLVDEHLRMADDMYRRSQAEENFDQKVSSLNDVSKPTRGLLFHTSVSLSSITEEPETVFESVDHGGTSENMNILITNLVDKISPDSPTKKFLAEENMQPLENNDLCGSKIVASIIDLRQEDQILNSIQGEQDTNHIHMKNENRKPKEYDATQSLLDASLDIPYIESFEREITEKEEELDDFTEELTTQTEDKAHEGDFQSSPCQVLTKLYEVPQEKGLEQEKSNDEYAKPDKIHDVLEAFTSQPYIQLPEDYGNTENGCDVFILKVQDSNNSQDFHDESNVEEESIGTENTHNAQDSQQLTQQGGLDSYEGISPRTLEISQQPKHDDAVYPNTVSQGIAEDIFAAAAKDSTATENLKPDEQVIEEAVEKDIEHNSQPMHQNTGLIAKEDDEESNTVNGAVHSAETKTAKDRNNILEDLRFDDAHII